MNVAEFRSWRLAAWTLLAGLACLTHFPGQAAGNSLDLPQTRLVWPADDRAVAVWDTRTGKGDQGWRSLISLDERGGRLSEHLRIHFATDGWLAVPPTGPDAVAGQIRREFASPDEAWRMRQTLAPADEPHRLLLTIELEAVAPGAPLPGDYLRLSIGPGLGEIPMKGLGIAAGLYSFVEAVAQVGGETHRFRLDKDDPDESIAVDQWHGDNWLGLNSRYFALLLAQRSGPAPGRLEFGLAASPDPESLPDRFLPWTAISLPLPEGVANEAARWQFEIFSGPKSLTALGSEEAGNYTELLFHGLWRWMRALSFALLWVLEMLYALVPNWGLAICLLAVLVRVILYPLARWALASQQRFSEVQAVIQPEIRAIKQQYKGEEQSERILKLYEQHGVSPLAGLKPLLIVLLQLPVFVALFHVLGQAYELKEASFLWIDSLAEPDRLFGFGVDLPFFGAWFNLLPVLMALTTLITIKLSPAPAATPAERRRQNVFLGLMAAGFFLLFYPFPSGMVLYWTVANVLHIAQARLFRGERGKVREPSGLSDD